MIYTVNQKPKSKIEITHRSQQKYHSHSKMNPQKYQTYQKPKQWITNRQSSKYQTLEHKNSILLSNSQADVSRNFSNWKKRKQLTIETECINYDYSQMPNLKKDNTPLFAGKDAIISTQHHQNKAKTLCNISYDNLIEAVKINYNKQDEDLKVNNISEEYFQISQSKIYDNNGNSQLNPFTQSLNSSLINQIHSQVNQLLTHFGENQKLLQINKLLSQLQQDLPCSKMYLKKPLNYKMNKLEENQIQNSLMFQSYHHNTNTNWFLKQKITKLNKMGDKNQRFKTSMYQAEKQKQNKWDKAEIKNSYKGKSPFRQILNYVNKKR